MRVFMAGLYGGVLSIGKIGGIGYSVANMSHRAAASVFERLVFLPEEANDPERRFTKSLYFLFALAAVLIELLSGPGIVHFALAGMLLASLVLALRSFRPGPFALAFVIIGWVATVVATSEGRDASLWHWFLPAATLVIRNAVWGWLVLGIDAGVSITADWLLGGETKAIAGAECELIAIAVFLLALVLSRVIRHTINTFKRGESRWAEQATLLETLTDLIPFPLFQKESDGRYISANASFRVVFDVAKDAVNGHTNEEFLLPENAKALAKVELDLLAREAMAVEETVLIHADGHPHDFIVYLMPLIDARQVPRGFLGVLIDITDRKHREHELVQLNATKDQLFSIISHDLRGPVGKLKQLLDIYIDDPSIFDKATWDQVFHDMRRSTDSLFQLLENLLSWARSQQSRGNVHYEAVSVEPLVADIFSVLKLLAEEKKITLSTDIQLQSALLSDRHVLSTIVRNLVHNALKFTMPGGRVTVSAGESDEDAWIEVQDTGVGMADDMIHRIFDNKERVSTYGTGKERGQGIGLGLCEDLATTLGAHLKVKSKIGEGTAIRLHLPTPEL
jgi:PAS domain S-box-containing protein